MADFAAFSSWSRLTQQASPVFYLQLSKLHIVFWLRSDLQSMSVFFTIKNTLSLSALLSCMDSYSNRTAHKVAKRRLPVFVVDLAMSPQKESILVETLLYQVLIHIIIILMQKIIIIHTFRAKAKHEFAMKCLRHSLPKTINETPDAIKNKIYTHSLHGFIIYIKTCLLNNYSDICTQIVTYVN